ncbi:MAG: DUF362 domain-containing protein [Planctomycetes bacterium]|nr:DUF362 domain-containing protein [Planctomycetota bacterium]
MVCRISRRRFLGRLGAGVGLSWAGAVVAEEQLKNSTDAVTKATPPGYSAVGVATSADKPLGKLRADLDTRINGAEVDALVRRALLDVDDSKKRLSNTIARGDWVVIKPNIVTCCNLPFSRYTCHGQVTDLRVVKTLIDVLLQQGKAKRITIAEDGGDWQCLGEKGIDPEQTFDGWTVKWPEFDNLSYVDIVKAANKKRPGTVDIVDLNMDPCVKVAVPGGGMALKEYVVPKTILNCDKLISAAALKTNNYAGVTLALKNYIGIAPSSVYGYEGTTKLRLPHDQINEVIVDLFSFHPADYAIITGTRGMEGYGPIWGDDLAWNVVIAGGDPVACDTVASRIMGYNPWDIGAIHNAAAKRLGVNDLAKIYVRGDGYACALRRFKKAKKEYPLDTFSLDRYYGRGNRCWLISGPHDAASLPNKGFDHDFLGGESAARPREGGQWRRMESKYFDYMDLKKHFKYQAEQCVTYAFTYILSDAPKKCRLLIGNQKGAKVWLNGRLVLSDSSPDPKFSFLQHRVDVELQKGPNPLLIKVLNTVGKYGFSAALADEHENTPFGVAYQLTA